MREWNCVNCGWITSDNTVNKCDVCTDALLIVPLRMNNALHLAVDEIVTFFYKLDTSLNQREDAVELYSQFGNCEKIATIRNWEDFRRFFGDYFYRQFEAVRDAEGTDTTE